MVLLEIKNLNFTYPEAAQPALSGINLEIQPGEFVLICGASGCGKSTLLRQCKPALSQHGEKSGAIYFNGKAIEELSFREQSEKIGFVMQDPEMQIVTDKVRHELAFGLESLGTNNRKMRVRIAEEPEDCVILGAGRAVQWIDSVKMDAGKENGNVPLTAYY